MKHRAHSMPFGAEVQPDGTTRFALWAPDAARVALCLERNGMVERLPMPGLSDGWFQLTTPQAAPGDLYRFAIGEGPEVPDPASRYQPQDVHGPSQVIDPRAYAWHDDSWRGRPWNEAVIYELHVGTFTRAGNFAAVQARLDWLFELGVTAIELMPVADFPGVRSWGYDGVLPYAPDSSYGTPQALKALVAAAHERGLMVLLDVVYNHFGPEGNYLHRYASAFFSTRHETPWGPALNFDGAGAHWVRQFFIHNALYWLEEFHLDGLRIDAVETIHDDSDPDFLSELAAAVHAGPGRQRTVHLILENDANAATYLTRDAGGSPCCYTAQWNDDLHHALHVLLTGEHERYYVDFADRPLQHLTRCLTEGFAYQGEPSAFRGGQPRGEPSAHLPPGAFVAFLQNHDQVGNRPYGERITVLAAREAIEAALAIVLLAPAPPLLFMGQEWGTQQPFLFFCDLASPLAARVRSGRRHLFAATAGAADTPGAIPDPADPETFRRSVLDWRRRGTRSGAAWVRLHRSLLAIRAREVTPRLGAGTSRACAHDLFDRHGLSVAWVLGDGSCLTLLANLGPGSARCELLARGAPLLSPTEAGTAVMAPWEVRWFLARPS